MGAPRRLPALVRPGPRHGDARDHHRPVDQERAMSRLPVGGRIDRSRPLRFTFNGHAYRGFAGDTLASALLANDVRVVAKSVTFGRPRGGFSAGIEEPEAPVPVGNETMLRATQVELVDGLDATGLDGKGRLTSQPDPARFDKIYAHCEVLVIGGGRSGITTALDASRTGDRVMLVDEQPEPGGRLLGEASDDWLHTSITTPQPAPDIPLLPPPTSFLH